MKKKYFRIISMICMISMLCGIFGYAPSVQAVTIPQGPSLAKQVSDEGLVLLKNDNSVLPLAAGTNISVFGGGQNNWQHETASAAEIFPPYVISLMDEMCIRDSNYGLIYESSLGAGTTVFIKVPGNRGM